MNLWWEGGPLYVFEDRIILFEWKQYTIYSRELEELSIRGIGDVKPLSVELDSDEKLNKFDFSFKNYLGLTELTFKFKDLPQKSFEALVVSDKIAKIEGLQVDTDNLTVDKLSRLIEAFNKFAKKLTDDISRISSSLNFEISLPTGFTVEESFEPMNELFAYHYLRANQSRILEAFETVMHKLKRELHVKEEFVEVYRVDEVTPDTILSILTSPENLVSAGSDVLIAKRLKGFAPERVLSSTKYETANIPENRFVKFFLNLIAEWTQCLIDKNVGIDELSGFRSEIECITSSSVWDEIEDMTVFPYNSHTLLKGDGYRDLLQLFREFTTYSPFFDEWKRAIDNKDIPKLYEYWCFFKLVEELKKISGDEYDLKIKVELGRIDESNVYAKFENGWKLYFNKKFGKLSYSIPLRPDYSLFAGDKLIGVFDAKFKLEVVELENFERTEKELEEEFSYETWARIEDIYKMHTYRDALQCDFAAVLYPGSKSVFWGVDGEKIENLGIRDILPDVKKGIGYISFNPMHSITIEQKI
ncbi:DUF2357 domain-containing protein [Archaeoglobus sp.]|uniref:DUF2357 domain-containing protein n=1 Tax=Archaeoglobus sp. TaxID=1872626 RepID=UPI0024AC7752|nr:DUF2357 domain-containing protein [Archaeoglobus sp.]MDI3498307.1 hypothetical protein [Archaeoglobus sp.]